MHAVYIAYTSFIKCLDGICSVIDRLISYLSSIKAEIKTELDEEVNDKIMLEAEVEQLRNENRKLKKLYYPKKLKYDAELDIYQCPNCKKIVSPARIEEEFLYCNMCGQRVYFSEERGAQL